MTARRALPRRPPPRILRHAWRTDGMAGRQEPAGPQRSDVVAMLATYGDRQPEQVPEAIDSMELAWLIWPRSSSVIGPLDSGRRPARAHVHGGHLSAAVGATAADLSGQGHRMTDGPAPAGLAAGAVAGAAAWDRLGQVVTGAAAASARTAGVRSALSSGVLSWPLPDARTRQAVRRRSGTRGSASRRPCQVPLSCAPK